MNDSRSPSRPDFSFILHASSFILPLLPALSRWFLPGLPAGADTAVHFFRAVQLDWLIRHGILYSRWLPDLVFGYGYPLFNYYGPLANYIIVLFHLLGLPFIPATLAAFALADLIGAAGAYFLARDTLGGKAPALVSAIAYVYSPYLLASLYRGALPESFGLALLPWLLWALHRLYHSPTPRRFALAAALFALFPVTHNPSAALAGVIAIAFVFALWLANRTGATAHTSGLTQHPLFIGHCALFIGSFLSAFFWLPLVLELNYIDISKAYAPAVINFRYNFLSLGQVFAPPRPIDPNMIGVSVRYGLGWPQVVLAVIGLFFLPRRTREQKVLLGLAAGAAPLLIALTLPQALAVWENAPGLSLIQFPARLLGPASLLAALLCGNTFAETRPAAPLPTAAAVAGILLFGFGWLYTGTDRAIPSQPTLADIHLYEHRSGVVGTTTAAEYLPRWVEQRPPDLSLDYTNPPINRLDRDSLPEGAQVISETPGPLAQSVELESPSDFVAVFDLFYFPGWMARVDGEAVSIAPTPVNGLISFPVPAGRRTVELSFTDTPPRTIGNALSLLALIGLAAVALRGGPGWKVRPAMLNNAPDGPLRGTLAAIAVTGLAAIGFKLAVVDRSESLFLQNKIESIQHPLEVSFGDQLQLIGYDDDGTLYWRALQRLSGDWSVSAALEWEGRRVAQSDTQHPGGLPTSRWFPDQFARDEHDLTPIPGAPPGAYELRVTVYRQSDGAVLQPAGVRVGELQVARPQEAARLIRNLPGVPLGPIELIGVEPLQASVISGDTVPLTLHWRANETPAQDMQVELWLGPEAGPPVYTRTITPTRPDFGTSRWRAGDEWIGYVDVKLPADISTGVYFVSVTTPNGLARLMRIDLQEPRRTYDRPAVTHALNVQFGRAAALIGWDYAAGRLTLYWQSTGLTEVNYKVFVHVLDGEGNIIDQRDRVPAGGARPTTSWLPGEYLADPYDLPLPAEAAAIGVGLYDPATGERLSTPDGGDFVLIQP